jgi:hypothetical protein
MVPAIKHYNILICISITSFVNSVSLPDMIVMLESTLALNGFIGTQKIFRLYPIVLLYVEKENYTEKNFFFQKCFNYC